MQSFLQDLRYGARMLAKHRSFTAIAALTLALGIGANTAMFSAIEAIYIHSLPYHEADRLVYLSASFPNSTQGNDNLSYAAFADWQAQSQLLERMAAYQDWVAVSLTGRDEPARLTANFITGDYFALFQAATVLGRVFTPEETRVPSSHQVTVISYDCWQNIFGRDPAIIGRQIQINQAPYTIVGVMRPDFRDLDSLRRPAIDAWIPLGVAAQSLGYRLEDRNPRLFWGVARLKPGVELAAAKAEAAAITKRMAEAYPATDKGFGLYVESLRDHFFRELYGPLKLLLIGSGFVLLIGCANVANLLLSRAAGRRKEMAVRAALGATRARLLRQLLIESVLLSTVAGAIGLLLAAWGTHLLNSWSALQLPGFARIEINGVVLVASLSLSLLTGLVFGLAPAWESARIDIRDALNQAGRQSGESRRRLSRSLLVIAEVSLSFALLIGAGLMLKSFQTLMNRGVGFRTENLLTLQMDLTAANYAEAAARVQFAQRLVEKAGALPGIESATLWGPAPLGRATWVILAAPEGKPINSQEDLTMTWRHSASPGALSNLGLPLLRGRDFTWQDTDTSPQVAIVSESVARLFWPGQDAVGQRFVRRSTGGLMATTVIGVAADANHRRRYVPSEGAGWAFQPQLDIYQPYAQRPNLQIGLALRTRIERANVLMALRQATRSLDGDLAFYDLMMLDQRLADQAGAPRAIATLMTAYAVAALLLAALGLYGVLAHLVTQRTQEIGIRLALGANRRDVLMLVIWQGARMTLIGMAVGLLAAFALTQLMANLLFGVSATDPVTFTSIGALLSAVALLACYILARRATKVDPIVALKCE